MQISLQSSCKHNFVCSGSLIIQHCAPNFSSKCAKFRDEKQKSIFHTRHNLSHWPLYPEVSKMKSINFLPDFSGWQFLKKIIKVNVTDCGYGKTEDRSFFLILFLNQIGTLCLLYTGTTTTCAVMSTFQNFQLLLDQLPEGSDHYCGVTDTEKVFHTCIDITKGILPPDYHQVGVYLPNFS